MLDERYMQRCFDLAKRGAGTVSPNPMVGAVLVCNGKIIGEGWHKAWGQAHAEVNCFQSVKLNDQHLIPSSTLYCSLEPCSHFGKTPPCADLIIAQKVPRVVVSNTDPNPVVAGKGLSKLRQAGIEITQGVLETEGAWINRFFFTWIHKRRPFVILKWAQSVDGFLGERGKRTSISGPQSQRLVHQWRSVSDAILVGAGTALIDDPKLDVRHYFGENPLRVLLDGQGSVPLDRHLLRDAAPTLIFGSMRTDLPSQKSTFPMTGRIPMVQILEVLHKENRATLLVEGGADVLNQFIQQELWDEIRIIENSNRIGAGIEAPKIPSGVILKEKFRVGFDTVSVYSPTF